MNQGSVSGFLLLLIPPMALFSYHYPLSTLATRYGFSLNNFLKSNRYNLVILSSAVIHAGGFQTWQFYHVVKCLFIISSHLSYYQIMTPLTHLCPCNQMINAEIGIDLFSSVNILGFIRRNIFESGSTLNRDTVIELSLIFPVCVFLAWVASVMNMSDFEAVAHSHAA